MGDLSNFEKGQIVGARLVGAPVTKTAVLLGVSRATVSKIMSAYTNHGTKTSAKRNSGRKSTLTERYDRTLRRAVSKNYTTAASQATAELNIHLEGRVFTKTDRNKLKKSKINGRAVTAKSLITESNAQMRKRLCYDHKTWTSDNWKRESDMVR
jgi:transposase